MPYKQGFTLIELLIAISILAILMALSYAGLNSVLISHKHLTAQQTRFKEFNYTFTELHNTLHHITARPVSDAYGTLLPALSLDYNNGLSLSFTRLGRPNPSGLQRSSLQRLRYFIDENTLKKQLWLSPDISDASLFQQNDLINDIETIDITVLADNKTWYRNWPPQDGQPLSLLPKAVKIAITRTDKREFMQIIELPR